MASRLVFGHSQKKGAACWKGEDASDRPRVFVGGRVQCRSPESDRVPHGDLIVEHISRSPVQAIR